MDLNQLETLHVLLEEGSVGDAAKRLHLSQPAMSRALARLRESTGDAIFVRSGRRMVPTPFAEVSRAKVQEVLRQARTLLQPERTFSPEAEVRTFTLRCPEVVSTYLALKLAAPPFSRYPHLRFRFFSEPSNEDRELRYDEVDLDVTAAPSRISEVSSREIGHDHLVVVSRRPTRNITLKHYVESSHVLVSRRGRLSDPVDSVLSLEGLKRHVVMAVPNSASALLLVSRTDFLVTVPERLSQPMLRTLKLHTSPFPRPLEPIPIVLSWHKRVDGDPGHQWMRRTIEGVLRNARERQYRNPELS